MRSNPKNMSEVILPSIKIIQNKNLSWALMDTFDSIQNSVRNSGSFNDLEVQMCFEVCKLYQNSLVLDVGANIGTFSIPLAERVINFNTKVYAFEPQRITFYQLCTNLFLNSLNNVYPFNLACGDEKTLIDIPEIDYQNSKNIGGFSVDEEIRKYKSNLKLTSHQIKTSESFYKVEVNKIDQFLDGEKICFLKVDVKGNEFKVIKGAERVLKNSQFPPVLFEDNDSDLNQMYAKPCFDFLRNLGYDFVKLGDNVLAHNDIFPVRFSFLEKGEGEIEINITLQK